jgi:hypothetical protein
LGTKRNILPIAGNHILVIRPVLGVIIVSMPQLLSTKIVNKAVYVVQKIDIPMRKALILSGLAPNYLASVERRVKR